MSEKVKLTIDGKEVEVNEGITVLQAAKQIGIDIPTLCFLKDVNQAGECRICIVEIEGRRGFVPSCRTIVEEGMKIKTNTIELNEARRIILDLILSAHHRDCLTCVRNGNCELQALADKFGVTEIHYEGQKEKAFIDEISPSIVRDNSKCIMCKRCVATCKNVQKVGAIDVAGRGFHSRIAAENDESLNNVNCTFCGQCIEACPVGALKEKDETATVWRKLRDKDTFVVVQTAPAVRAALGEEFGMPIGTCVTVKMVTALKRLGFDKVFDTLETGLSKLGDTSGARTKAISGLLQLIKDIPMDGKQDYDVLGFVYEYLIEKFASNAGKKAGEFYTPHEVSVLMSEIVANHLKGKDEIKIYDPTSGSGSLLINIGKSVSKYVTNSDNIKYYAQELKENTYNLTRMNLVMRGIKPSNITTRCGDTLEEDWPYFDDSNPSETYKCSASAVNVPIF